MENATTIPKLTLSETIRSYVGKYVIVSEPKYTYLRIKPSSSVRNYDSGSIIKLLNDLYHDLTKHMVKANKCLCYYKVPKISYYIYMEKQRVEFYFIVPEDHYMLFKQKLRDIWKNKVIIEQVDEIPMVDVNNASSCFMSLKNQEAFSLSCDKRNNEYLHSLLNVTNILKDGDKIAVLYNFIPTSQKYWKSDYDAIIEKKRLGKPVYSDLSVGKFIWMMFVYCAITIDQLLDIIMEVCFGQSNSSQTKKKVELKLTDETRNKRKEIVTKTQILCMSQAQDKFQEMNNLISLAGSFEVIATADNELVMKRNKEKINKSIDIFDTKIKGVKPMRLQQKEIQNIISVPADSLLAEFPQIEHTKVRENQEIPTCHQTGVICVGDCRRRTTEEMQKVYLSTDYNNGGSVTCAIGLQGSGKTTFQVNYAKNVIDANYALICIDYIKDCEASKDIEKITPKDRLVIVDFSDFRNPQSFAFTELKPKEYTVEYIVEVANRKSQQMKELVDALTINSGDVFAPAMQDIVINASTILYSYNQNASMKDLYTFLTDYNYRASIINGLHPSLKEELKDQISTISMHLNARNRNGEDTGLNNSSTSLTGVLTRLSLLRNDYRLSKMFSADSSNNIDLVKAIDEKKVILFRLPQAIFSSTYAKDTIVCYLVSRIWNAVVMLGEKYKQNPLSYLLIDELFQCPTTLTRFRDSDLMLQQRKFGLRSYFTCQHIKQYRVILEALKSTGCNFLFMKGSTNSFSEFEDELVPYTKEDIVNLPQYSSLVSLCNSGDRKYNAIVSLPPPIK